MFNSRIIKNEGNFEDLLLLSFLSFLALNILLTSFFLIINFHSFEIVFVFSFVISFLILFYVERSSFVKNAFFFLVIFIISFLLSKYVFRVDISPDANTAHIPMVFYLSNNYNPFYDFSGNLENWNHEFVFRASYYGNIGLKGIAYSVIPVVKFFKDTTLELINIYSYILFFFYLIYSYKFTFLFKNLTKKLRFIIFTILVSNPIIIGEITTFYFDQYIAIAIFFIIYFFIKKTNSSSSENNNNYYFILLFCFIASVSKLNGLFFINILLFIIILYNFIQNNIKNYLKFFLISSFYVLAVIIANFNPLFNIGSKILSDGLKYNNIVENGDTNLWPGKEKYLMKSNRYKILLDSLLSPTEVNPEKHPKKLEKIKNLIKNNELITMSYVYHTDIRNGGFGPFFGFSFILSLILLAQLIYKYNDLDKRLFSVLLFIIISVSSVKYPAFARHIPQLYYFNLLLILLIYISNINFGFFFNFVKNVMIILILLNSAAVFSTSLIRNYLIHKTVNLEKNFESKIRGNSVEKKVQIFYENWYGTIIRNGYVDNNEIVESLSRHDSFKSFNNYCKYSYNFWRVTTRICLQSKDNKESINFKEICKIEDKLRSVINLGSIFRYKWDWNFIREHKKSTEVGVCSL